MVKKKYIMILWIAALSLLGCNESMEDTYGDYTDGGKIRYVAKCTGLDVIPGWKCLSLTWKNSTDATIKNIKVVWTLEMQKDSILLDGTATSFELRNLIDATYRFDVLALDGEGRQSLTATNYGRPYTETHEVVRTFTNVITKSYQVGNNLIFWTDKWNDNIFEVTLKYKDAQGEEQIHEMKKEDFGSFITLSNVSDAPQDSVYIMRVGRVENCPDTITFLPLTLNKARMFTSDFVIAVERRYGFSDKTDEKRNEFNRFIDTVRTLEFDYSMTSFEDVLYCPKLEKLILAKNRYASTKYGFDWGGAAELTDEDRSIKVLDKANELLGMTIQRYGREHYFRKSLPSYMTTEEDSQLPDLKYLLDSECKLGIIDSITISSSDLGDKRTLMRLLDNDPETRWESRILSRIRSYDLVIHLHEERELSGIKISQMLYDPLNDWEAANYCPKTVIVKTSTDQMSWKDVTHVEENFLGDASGEVTLLPFHEGKRKVRYIMVKLSDQVYDNLARVILGDIVAYE